MGVFQAFGQPPLRLLDYFHHSLINNQNRRFKREKQGGSKTYILKVCPLCVFL